MRLRAQPTLRQSVLRSRARRGAPRGAPGSSRAAWRRDRCRAGGARRRHRAAEDHSALDLLRPDGQPDLAQTGHCRSSSHSASSTTGHCMTESSSTGPSRPATHKNMAGIRSGSRRGCGNGVQNAHLLSVPRVAGQFQFARRRANPGAAGVQDDIIPRHATRRHDALHSARARLRPADQRRGGPGARLGAGPTLLRGLRPDRGEPARRAASFP